MAFERKGGAVIENEARNTGMSDRDFNHFSQFIHREVGIKLPPSKKIMVEARLQKRIRALKMAGIKEYVEFLFSKEGMRDELTFLIDAITTNTTDFFREPQHFDLMSTSVLPGWFAANGRSKRLSIWSAGCSVGMEPYTLAMVLAGFKENNPGFQFTVLGTDISTQALQAASRAVYDEDKVAQVPTQYKHKYLLRSKDRNKRLVRIVPELRRTVNFRRLNFMENFSLEQPVDIIFCRNVVIYFDKPTQERLFTKLCNQLLPGGYLFIGHSESLTGMSLPLAQHRPTVYIRQ
ncbi:MAG: chemotaxis protein CheR [Desulfovibrio sp.]|nr:MAG: chemotaxis protein CheR [Desulfovibrio sp.]